MRWNASISPRLRACARGCTDSIYICDPRVDVSIPKYHETRAHTFPLLLIGVSDSLTSFSPPPHPRSPHIDPPQIATYDGKGKMGRFDIKPWQWKAGVIISGVGVVIYILETVLAWVLWTELKKRCVEYLPVQDPATEEGGAQGGSGGSPFGFPGMGGGGPTGSVRTCTCFLIAMMIVKGTRRDRPWDAQHCRCIPLYCFCSLHRPL